MTEEKEKGKEKERRRQYFPISLEREYVSDRIE